MPKRIGPTVYYSTHEAADSVGMSKATLLRWLKSGQISPPKRDVRGWRIFSEDDLGEIRAWAHKTS